MASSAVVGGDVIDATYYMCLGSGVNYAILHPAPPDIAYRSKVRILENRLDKALTKFNEVLAHNKILRQEVIHEKARQPVQGPCHQTFCCMWVDLTLPQKAPEEYISVPYQTKGNELLKTYIRVSFDGL